ncbi:hypothetical protein N1027_11405 [Herbiconiux sp. CPCC 205763]|uniref:Uncharacterized protein n=1 Tax=Herbiconiux aconitum TaxID=2970913 RepID=A0ABT2GRA3_9MICO|nr:hypothetical protein [Herbiconiux aconitum]MCS5718739.1 hypothetical protein [Herbiconiux aconitum]
MTSVVVYEAPRKELPRAAKGGVFVLFWIIAIVLWIIAPNITDPRWGAFIVDTGLVFASVGFAAPGITWTKPFRNTLIAGAIAILLFLWADLNEVTVVVYFLRMAVPFAALLTSVYTAAGKLKVWY